MRFHKEMSGTLPALVRGIQPGLLVGMLSYLTLTKLLEQICKLPTILIQILQLGKLNLHDLHMKNI